MCLLGEVQVQKYFCNDALGVNKQELVSRFQSFVFKLQVPAGDRLEIRYFEVPLLLVVLSPVLVTKLSIVVFRKSFDHGGLTHRLGAHNNYLLGEIGLCSVADEVPIGERFFPYFGCGDGEGLSLDIHIVVVYI